MPRESHEITRADVLSMEDFGAARDERRAEVAALKQNRRVEVGPYATFYFECFETMWLQVHEMLRIERGGDAQVAGEIEAYNPLIPKGREFVATLMFEIDNADRRARELAKLGGVEETIRLHIGNTVVAAVPEVDVTRTTAAGRTSSVHFLHFPLTDTQANLARDSAAPMVLEIDHVHYPHMTRITPAVRAELCRDLD